MSGEADAEVLPGSEPAADAGHDPGIEDVAAATGSVPWWRRLLVIGAVAIAAATTSWLSGRSPVGLVGLLVVLLTLLPALARSRSFSRSAVAVAIVVFLLAIAGVFLLGRSPVVIATYQADPDPDDDTDDDDSEGPRGPLPGISRRDSPSQLRR